MPDTFENAPVFLLGRAGPGRASPLVTSPEMGRWTVRASTRTKIKKTKPFFLSAGLTLISRRVHWVRPPKTRSGPESQYLTLDGGQPAAPGRLTKVLRETMPAARVRRAAP